MSEKGKLLSLLRFYGKNGQKIELKVLDRLIMGKVIKYPGLFCGSVIIKTNSGELAKFFIQDIEVDSIFPSEQFKKEIKKRINIPKSVKKKIWRRLFGERFRGNCPVCKEEIERDDFEAGHIISVKNGGSDNEDNLQPICKECNRSMGDEDLNEFKRRFH